MLESPLETVLGQKSVLDSVFEWTVTYPVHDVDLPMGLGRHAKLAFLAEFSS